MFLSILLPMLLSSLHLAVNNFSMFYDQSNKTISKVRKYLLMTLLFILSPINPVILESRLLDTAEEARKLAQNYNILAVQKKTKSRQIKKQITRFGRIELGRYCNFCCLQDQYLKVFLNIYNIFQDWKCMYK